MRAAKMAEVIKTYSQKIPATRFIGKIFGNADRVNGGFGAQWGEAFHNGWFDTIEKAAGGADKCVAAFKDGGAYIGLMHHKENEPFEYWVGMFTPADTPVPDGFGYVDFPESKIGVAWLKGKENTGELYGKEPLCLEAMNKSGIKVSGGEHGGWWFFERYTCPRFTTPDENGDVILDICFF